MVTSFVGLTLLDISNFKEYVVLVYEYSNFQVILEILY